MELNISTPHESYPPEATAMVRERVSTLERIADGANHVRAVIDREHAIHRVELVASSWGRSVHRVEARADSLLGAVNEAVHRLERALRRREDRHRDLQRREGA
jgi:ribosomal subunit interface protein